MCLTCPFFGLSVLVQHYLMFSRALNILRRVKEGFAVLKFRVSLIKIVTTSTTVLIVTESQAHSLE